MRGTGRRRWSPALPMVSGVSWRNGSRKAAGVLVHGRDRARGAEVVAGIAAGGGTAEFFAADLSALAEVRRLAAEVQKATARLDLLINNAGIGSHGPREVSADGHELRFAVNLSVGRSAHRAASAAAAEEERARPHRQRLFAWPGGDRLR